MFPVEEITHRECDPAQILSAYCLNAATVRAARVNHRPLADIPRIVLSSPPQTATVVPGLCCDIQLTGATLLLTASRAFPNSSLIL